MTSTPPLIEVYWVSGSPYSWRVLLALEAKRVPYRSRLLEASKGELKSPEYLALNPRGKVPTLKDGDFVLAESLAILQYLEHKHPQPALFGRTARETARIWQLVSEYFSYLNGPVDRIVRPLYFGKAGEKADDIRAAAPEAHAELARLENTTQKPTWLAADELSAADIAIYPFVKSLLRAASKNEAKPLDLGFLPFDAAYPRLDAWMKRVESLPGYERTVPPHWRQ
jgi:glutathione S-transferase